MLTSRPLKLSKVGLSLYMFFFALRFAEGFWVLYFRSRGYTFALIGALETCFHMASLSSEVPTGVIADRYGRKKSLVIGRLLAFISSLIIVSSRSPLASAIGFGANAISYTCHSGAFEALVYDSVRSNEYTKVLGSLNSWYLLGASAAGVMGGYIASRNLNALYTATAAADLLAALAIILVTEVPPSDRSREKQRLRTQLESLGQALKTPGFLRFSLLFAMVSAVEVSARFYGQSVLKAAGLTEFGIGVAQTAANILPILPARYSHIIEKRLGTRRTIVFGSLFIPSAMTLLGTSLVRPFARSAGWHFLIAASAYLGITAVYEGVYPVFSSVSNSLLNSDIRASALSSQGMIFSIVMMVLFPLVGRLSDSLGLPLGLTIAGGVSAALLGIASLALCSRCT